MAAKQLPHDHGTKTQQLLEQEPSQAVFERTSDTFRLISDSTRLKILWLLCHSEECVINIAAAIDMSSPAVSHHLRILKQTGLLTSRRVGKETYYTLSSTKEADLVHQVIDQIFDMHCERRQP